MKQETKQILLTTIVGTIAVVLMRTLHLENGLLASLESNAFIASTRIIEQFHKSLANNEPSALLLCYGLTFALVALPTFSLSRTWPLSPILRAVARGRPSFLRPPERVMEPLLLQLGITRALAFFGRSREMAELDAFAEQPGRFLWWSMHGPGGVGKTRLAAEWMLRRSAAKRLDVGFLDRSATTSAAIQAFRPRRDTLIVVDEALLFTPELWNYLATVADGARQFRHKVRVLLIDWTPLADPPDFVLSEMESLVAEALMATRHYQAVVEPIDRPRFRGGVTVANNPGAAASSHAGTFAEFSVRRESLAIRPFTDRTLIESIVRDVASADARIDIDDLIEATQGNPLLVVASALHPDEPPIRAIEGMARKILARAEALDRKTGSHMATTLAIGALAGPVDHSAYVEFTGRAANPAALMDFFAQPRAAMRQTLPALEPELLAHQVALQHMGALDASSQSALASLVFQLNPQRVLRITGNLWRVREESMCATALAAGVAHLVILSDGQTVNAQVMHALANAAGENADYRKSPLAKEMGSKALRLLRIIQDQDGATDADADAILKLAIQQMDPDDFAAVFDELEMRRAFIPAVTDALNEQFDSNWPRRAVFEGGDATNAILEALTASEPMLAAAAAIETMTAAYKASPARLTPEQETIAIQLAEALTKRAVDEADGVRVAVAWACSWLGDLRDARGNWFCFSQAQNERVLEGLRLASSQVAIGLSAHHLGAQFQRPPAIAMLLDWAGAIDAGMSPLPHPVDPRKFENPLKGSLIELIAHYIASSELDFDQLRRLGTAAIDCDALGAEMTPAIQVSIGASEATPIHLARRLSRIATTAHSNRGPTLRTAFELGNPAARFLAFLGLWAHGEADFAARRMRSDDLIDYAVPRGRERRSFKDKLVSLLGDDIHKLKARDTTGRWAYYYVLVPEEREHFFLNEIEGNGTVDLEDYGEVIASCYGEGPTFEMRSFVKDVYGFDV
jgi:hypothetical protein